MKRKSLTMLSLLLVVSLLFSTLISCGENPNDNQKEETTTKEPYVVPEKAESSPQNGLIARYYSDRNFTAFVASEVVEAIGGVWATGNEAHTGTGADNYSITYDGRFKAPITGVITFTSNCDDGVVLYIDGNEVINDAGPHYPEEHTGTYTVEKDKFYALSIRYYNGDLGGTCSLKWAYEGVSKSEIPSEVLYLPENPVALSFETKSEQLHVTASVQASGSEKYTLILVCDEEEVVRAERKTYQQNWEAVMEANEKEVTAFAVDTNGNRVSEIYKKYANEDARIVVDTSKVLSTVEPLLYGACMEDVNHELYGGIWSQMIFGEAFEEDGVTAGEAEWTPAGGSWRVENISGTDAVVINNTANGPKLVYNLSDCTEGTFSADIYNSGEGTGFLVKTTKATAGADSFDGYEVTVFNNYVRIAKHMHNYTKISDTSCTAPTNTWLNLKVEVMADSLKVYVNNKLISSYTDPSPIANGCFGFRTWNATGKYKNIKYNDNDVSLDGFNTEVVCAGMWRANVSNGVEGSTSIIKTGVYSGKQAQRLTFVSGNGAVSVNNMGLNRMGMNLQANKDYNGYFYAKSDKAVSVKVAFESADGSKRYCEQSVSVNSADYQKYSFSLTPDTTDQKGRFVIELVSAGTLDVDYVFCEPGSWGLYKGLHVRKDVGEAFEKQNVSVLRFGGCQANASDWKWKQMIGAPEERNPHTGWWYNYASYGFGIIEFMDFCEALGVAYIPDFNSNETAQDMADFVQFALGTDENNEWVQLRKSMGREQPYNLKYIELGNEEKVDVSFATKFNNLANAIWNVDNNLICVVGDFDYKDIITDPKHVTNSASGITNLDGQKLILQNAEAKGNTVWFDVHIWSEHNKEPISQFKATISFYEMLKQMVPNADTALCVFELNAAAHDLERTICNALATALAERAGGIIKIMCSANALQVDKQNDNGWDQGLIFMDNSGAWLQGSAYVDAMFNGAYLPNLVAFSSDENVNNSDFDVTVTASADGKKVCVKIINRLGKTQGVAIQIPSFSGACNLTKVSLSGGMKDVNTTENKTALAPVTEESVWTATDGGYLVTVEEYSITVLTFQVK